MKKILSIIAIAIIICGCACTESTTVTEIKDPCEEYKTRIESLNVYVKELEEQIDVMQEAIQWREAEISYWGHKYDSIKGLR